jgi:hypothetical protein
MHVVERTNTRQVKLGTLLIRSFTSYTTNDINRCLPAVVLTKTISCMRALVTRNRCTKNSFVKIQ